MTVTLDDLDITKPDGATEPVAVLDDYQREAKEATITSFGVEHSLTGEHKFLKDTTGNRPAPGFAGRLYFNITTQTLQYDNGSSWEDIAYLNQRILVGTYTGLGTGQAITGIGFAPSFVVVIPMTGTNIAFAKSRDFANGDSHKLADDTTSTTGIDTCDADGFTVLVGADVVGVVYAFVALRNNG